MLQRLNERVASRWAVLVCCCVTACALDHRVLKRDAARGTGASDDPGRSGSGADSAGGSADSLEPGSSGGSGASALPPLVDGCADLDSDGVADCNVTLLMNYSFGTDVAGWTGVDGATLTWDSDNALADMPSGCARLRAGDAGNGDALIFRASQCVVVPAGQFIIAYANARVDMDPALGTQMAHAELEVSYFDSPDCSGKSTGYFATPPSEASKNWVIIQAGGVSATNTAAVSVALVGIRPDRTYQQRICFDNLMVKAKPLP